MMMAFVIERNTVKPTLLSGWRAGDYQVSVKFNDQSIPDSPFNVYVSPSSADATTLDVTDLDQQVCQVSPLAEPLWTTYLLDLSMLLSSNHLMSSSV